MVLILVLMDDALVPGGILDEEDSFLAVLILVLMDDALVRMPILFSLHFLESLNPCFNG